MIKRIRLLISSVLFTHIIYAQEKELAGVNLGISKLQYQDTPANARLLDVKYKVPLYRKNKYFAVGTIGYKNVGLTRFPKSFTQNLHGLYFQMAWLYKISGHKTIAIFAQAGLFSDLKDVNGKDFRYSAGFRYRIKHSEKLSTGWGLAYSRQFFGNQIIPFVDVEYKPNNKWSITGQFPIKPKVLYHFNKKLSAGVEVAGDASSYRLSAFRKDNEFIQINQWAGLTKLEYKFTRSWQLNIGIGKNFEQAYKRYADASANSWTVITVPIGSKADPVEKIGSKGINIQAGVIFSPL